ncbi:uncharacterized protein M421DRAFT_328371 [Didymella exigua CBS 183.55]|uniref:Uncharacterized protein n=1 Tax=Didymella exigua CBS 183.55 TaxID=1150837 RepID=A0A6A5R8K6_9PLEO|nr:uncharacterized protein M421DRAFT_328371 [Didymella exigua CBS 183.55]KAF1923304.1 hypothetical protein M421DRAFT_328371 [Didymella exigua CBS 183.55]
MRISDSNSYVSCEFRSHLDGLFKMRQGSIAITGNNLIRAFTFSWPLRLAPRRTWQSLYPTCGPLRICFRPLGGSSIKCMRILIWKMVMSLFRWPSSSVPQTAASSRNTAGCSCLVHSLVATARPSTIWYGRLEPQRPPVGGMKIKSLVVASPYVVAIQVAGNAQPIIAESGAGS